MNSDKVLSQIRWGGYGSYEGPYFLGRLPYRPPSDPTFWQKVLAVVTATEGGTYDAVNMYDRCILSVGIIQWCEAASIFGVSKMLGDCAKGGAEELVNKYLHEMREPAGICGIGQYGAKWRFYDDGKQITTKEQQRALFLGGSTGLKGQWTPEQKEHAKRVAAVMATLWNEPMFRTVQENFTIKRLPSFAMPKSRAILFDKVPDVDGDPWEGALRAAFISFAANLPAVADKHFLMATNKGGWWSLSSRNRCIAAIRQMTFGPEISIYPHRYNKIRPVLEKLFKIDLPDFAEELEKFKQANPLALVFPDTESIQEELIAQGYDLGPHGADGLYGNATRAAVKLFEEKHNLLDENKRGPDGMPDSVMLDELASGRTKRLKGSSPPAPVPVVEPPEEFSKLPLERPTQPSTPSPLADAPSRPDGEGAPKDELAGKLAELSSELASAGVVAAQLASKLMSHAGEQGLPLNNANSETIKTATAALESAARAGVVARDLYPFTKVQ